MKRRLVWNWDYEENYLIANSKNKHYEDGSLFFYTVVQLADCFLLSGNTVIRPKRFIQLSGAIIAANRIDNS